MNYDLDNNNILYSWKDMDILTIFNKKYEKGNIEY